MEFVKILALRGPNIWAYFPVIEAWVDLGELKDSPSDSIPGFNERLMGWLPGMIEHRCSIGERGGFFERLRRGTYPAHILEHVTIELQNLAGSPGGFGRARETSAEGIYKVVFRYKDEALARECLAAGRELVLAAIYDRSFDLPGTLSRLRAIARQNLMDPDTEAIVQAARKRNIPFLRLEAGNIVQLGSGVRQRRIRASQSDLTSAVAESISQDLEMTRSLLETAGVPTVSFDVVFREDDAWPVADFIGFPVTVRPRGVLGGRGFTSPVANREQLLDAYRGAIKENTAVVIEGYVTGDDYHLLVVGGKLESAICVLPVQAASVEQSDASILTGAEAARCCPNGDEGPSPIGGAAAAVTELVHPDTVQQAIRAAGVVGLDVAGIHIRARDIAMPLGEQGGAIVAVTASPGLQMHRTPASGQGRPVEEAILHRLFAPGETGRIPIAAVTGTNGKTTVSRLLAHILREPGRTVGMTCTDGVYLNDHRIVTGDCSGPASALKILMHSQVDVAVLETARGGILRAGLAFNECTVAVVTNIGEGDHLGISDMNTPEDLAKVKRGIVEVVGKQGAAVLSATDPLVASMAESAPAPVIFFAIDPAHPVIREQLARGERAAFLRDGQLVLATGAQELALLPIASVPLTQGGRIPFEVENTLAAAAAAWAMGVPLASLAERLRSFASDIDKVPSRFNVIEFRGATVIIDFGHNVDALRALTSAVDTFPQTRRAAVFSSSGDRRDSDIIQMGRLLGGAFDRVILYEDDDLYNRQPGEITRLLRQGLAEATRTTETEFVEGALKALEHALRTIQPGELLVAQAHLSDPTVRFLKQFLASPDSTAG